MKLVLDIFGWAFLAASTAVFVWSAITAVLRPLTEAEYLRLRRTVKIFWIVSGLVVLARFTFGLGAVSAMDDGFPWGVWIGLLQSGVALAAGGFVVAATVHIFHLKRFEVILRPMVLTAFLGYTFVALTLFIEVGRPHRLWHPLVMWQHTSIMFEVAWCVTLYMTVLIIEFSPVIFEKLGKTKIVNALHVAAIPIVIAGVILSTLHQSSMGSMFLVLPEKVSGLWFSPLLPVFFLISAVAVGLCMAIVESFFSHRIFGRSLETALLNSIAAAARAVLYGYLFLKLADAVVRQVWVDAARDPWLGALWVLEVAGGILLPAVLFSIPKLKERTPGLLLPAVLVGAGVVLNRINVSWFSMVPSMRTHYFPTWMELDISLFLVTVTVAAFGAAVRYLPVFPVEDAVPPSVSSKGGSV